MKTVLILLLLSISQVYGDDFENTLRDNEYYKSQQTLNYEMQRQQAQDRDDRYRQMLRDQQNELRRDNSSLYQYNNQYNPYQY